MEGNPNELWCGTNYQICNTRPTCYSYLEMLLPWGDPSIYECKKKIGRGATSDVYVGKCSRNGKLVIVKIMKTESRRKAAVAQENQTDSKFFREVKILQVLFGGPSISKLIDVVRVNRRNNQGQQVFVPVLIFDFLSEGTLEKRHELFSHVQVQAIMYKLLKALRFAHEHGIIHRDVKSSNIAIEKPARGDEHNFKVELVDWGSACFYFPRKKNDVHTSTKYYKAPELLLEDQEYHFSIDIWALGCVFGELIFKKDLLFRGENDNDMLGKISKALGEESLRECMKLYNLTLNQKQENILKTQEGEVRPFQSLRDGSNASTATDQAIDLLKKMLVFDKNQRISCDEALNHGYFNEVRLLNL